LRDGGLGFRWDDLAGGRQPVREARCRGFVKRVASLYRVELVGKPRVLVRAEREIGILLPNNQRQHRTSHAPKDVRIFAKYCAPVRADATQSAASNSTCSMEHPFLSISTGNGHVPPRISGGLGSP